MTDFSRREALSLAMATAAVGLVPIPALADAGTSPESLNALAAAKGLRFGSCLGTGPSGAMCPSWRAGSR